MFSDIITLDIYVFFGCPKFRTINIYANNYSMVTYVTTTYGVRTFAVVGPY